MQTLKERYLRAKRALFDKVYAFLNERQREAVYTVDHPLLVLAGAGSGKTTVLVRRIAFIIRYGNAYLSDRVPTGLGEEALLALEEAEKLPAEEIEQLWLPSFAEGACEPYRVLAITFTNKAAGEIRERLEQMFPDRPEAAADIVTGTFHSLCVRILRRHGELMGYRQGFTIYDADDTKKAILAAMGRCDIDEKLLPVKSVINAIGRAKDKLLSPDAFSMEAGSDFRAKQVARVYEAYQQLLRESNAMDFDDLIMQTVLLLRAHPEICESYQRRFRYVCVDEFQDTNVAQLQLTVLLSGGYKNLMVVGDDDQSIYKFRGATIENILTFDRLFPEAKVIKLEQNYRSTQRILDAANAVIANNAGRKGKTLWTAAGEGAKLQLLLCDDQNAEAREVVDTVSRLVSQKKATYRDFAVLYRTNAQSNSLEKAFARSAVPYRVLGGTRFSDRKEIRDAVAYLQVISNRDDNLRLWRIINEPRRKLGAKTLDAIAAIAEEQGCSRFSVIENASRYTALDRSRATLESFADLINGLAKDAETMRLDVLFDRMLDLSGYRQMWVDAGPEEAERLENLEEFKSGILEYMEENETPTLTGFLEETALVADVDRYDETADAVVLMTVHSAKGLEFPIVLLPGMEEGLFPGMQTVTGGNAEIEEERRLAYVAITRAKRELYILHTRSRLLYGQTMYNPLSRFIAEIPESLLEQVSRTSDALYGESRHGAYGARGAEAAPGQRRTYYSEREEGYPRSASYAGRGEPSPYSSHGDYGRTRRDGARSSFGGGVTVGKPLQKVAKAGARETLSAGDRVLHPTFGEGDILSAKPMGADVLYEVAFDRVGTKKLMGTYAKLKKI